MRRAIAILVTVTACSGVSQGEFDDLQQRFDDARDDLATREANDAAQLTAEATVAAYSGALDSLDLIALNGVYAEGVVFVDVARSITFRSRRNTVADLESGINAYNIESQETVGKTVTPERAVVEWEMRGNIGGLDWSFRGVSVLELRDALIVRETMYYDPQEAPWGSG